MIDERSRLSAFCIFLISNNTVRAVPWCGSNEEKFDNVSTHGSLALGDMHLLKYNNNNNNRLHSVTADHAATHAGMV
jgi:hypothetical protein